MARFDSIYIAPRVRVALANDFEPAYRDKFWQLVSRLRQGRFDIPGLNVEKLYSKKGKVYSARLNVEMRVLFSFYEREGENSIVIWDCDHHDKAYRRAGKLGPAFLFSESDKADPNLQKGDKLAEPEAPDPKELTSGLMLFKVPEDVMEKPERYAAFDRNFDRFLSLSAEQEKLLSVPDKAYLVQGAAGTGKTTLALFYALNIFERAPEDDIFFFTYQDDLALVCRNYIANMVCANDDRGPKVFSYLQFCRNYLWKNLNLKNVSWKWIDKEASLKHLADIINSRPRWQRAFTSEQIWGYIYSIFKGRFVPGTDRLAQSPDDFQKILKGYGHDLLSVSLEEILEVLSAYQKRLSAYNHKDEADLIYFCYQNLKQKAILSSKERHTWIVIDEIQDFTELEWKSILLFWENKFVEGSDFVTYPFLSGDLNQNISRSGFRWQDADSYIDLILRKVHRPNKLVKVELEANVRNSREIFQLGKFIRHTRLHGNMESVPEISGPKPKLVIGETAQFLSFLNRIEASAVADNDREKLAAPLVVLCEDEADEAFLRAGRKSDEEHFLLSLAKCKGLEFEDCVVFRLFASAEKTSNLEPVDLDYLADSHFIDLWYMAVTRARSGLLVFLTRKDLAFVQKLLGAQFAAFQKLFDWHEEDVESCLLDFYARREKHLPNYHAVFIERSKAQRLWEEAAHLAKEKNKGQEAIETRQKALKAWRKCRDWESLGEAYRELADFENAVLQFQKINRTFELAQCYEQLARFDLAAKYFEASGEFLLAANAWQNAGTFGQAAPLFEKGGEPIKAAECYLQEGNQKNAALCFEQAECFELAAELYVKIGDAFLAARCFVQAGKYQIAAELFEQEAWVQEAALNYEKAGQFTKASSLYEGAGLLAQAAEAAKMSGNLEKAAEIYEQMGNRAEAASLFLQLQDKTRALLNAKEAGNYELARQLQKEAEDWSGYAHSCHLLGDHKMAAECFLKHEQFREAALCFEEAQKWKLALDCFLKANDWQHAARMCENLGQFLVAAEYYQKTFNNKEAAYCFERAGKFQKAAELYHLSGQYEREGHCHKLCRQFKKAAIAFENAKLWKEAIEMYKIAGDRDSIRRCEGYERWLP